MVLSLNYVFYFRFLIFYSFIEDPLWTIHRKALNPAFGQHIVVSFMNIFNAETGILLDELDNLVGKGETSLMTLLKNFTLRTSTRKQQFLFELTLSTTLDHIFTETTMGSDVKNEEIYKNGSMMKSYQSLFQIATDLIMAPWLNNRLMRHFYGYDKVLGPELSMIRSLIKKVCCERYVNEIIWKTFFPRWFTKN